MVHWWKFVSNKVSSAVSNWILATGLWNDGGVWDDNATWHD